MKKTNGDDVESVEVLKEAGKFLINRLNSLSYVLITNADPKFVFGLADIMNDPKCNKSEFSLEIGCATDSLDIGGDQYAKYWIKVNNHKKVDSVCKQMVDSINIAYDTQGLNVYVEAIKPKAEVVYRIWANNKMF